MARDWWSGEAGLERKEEEVGGGDEECMVGRTSVSLYCAYGVALSSPSPSPEPVRRLRRPLNMTGEESGDG